jgi:hypothetical protein
MRRCKKTGLAETSRFERRHRNKKMQDPEVMAYYFGLNRVLLTFDKALIDEHENDIPGLNPGIIVVQHSPALLRTLTQKSAEKIIAKFKEIIPDWYEVPWSNSIVRISDIAVEICRKEESGVVTLVYTELTETDCAEQIRKHLQQNYVR